MNASPQTTSSAALIQKTTNRSSAEIIDHTGTESTLGHGTSTTTPPAHWNVAAEISANDLVSRANYCYAVIAALGFLSAIFLFCSFIRSYRGARLRKDWTWMDTTLCTYCISEFYVLLFSTSSLVHRPQYMKPTGLNCAVLASLFNAACLSGELLQALMVFFPAFHQDPPVAALIQTALDKPAVCVAVMFLVSLVLSVILSALRGLSHLKECWLDPPDAYYHYYVVKLITAFVLPNLLKLSFLFIWKRSDSSFPSSLRVNPVFPAVIVVTFICRIFYYSVLMSWAAQFTSLIDLSPSQRALCSVAEFVLFSGSSVCLVLLLLLYSPCRKTLLEAAGYLRDCCNRIGGRETHSNLMTPHIEITEEPKENSEED